MRVSALALSYDSFSDVHGYCDELTSLFNEKMGYHHDGLSYVPPKGVEAIFLGDLPDRGPQQVKTIKTVWDMVKNGHAQAIAGNHELNIVAHSTPVGNGKFLRCREDKDIKKQHEAFFNEVVEDSADHKALVEWFKEMPIFLELDGIKYIHACWHQESIDVVKPYLNDNNALGDEGIHQYATNEEFKQAIYNLMMGPTYTLPEGMSYTDIWGNHRKEARILWASSEKRFSDRLDLRGGLRLTEEQKIIIDNDAKGRVYGAEEGLVKIGHYAQAGEPKVPQSTSSVMCGDFAKHLTGYRYKIGDTKFLKKQLTSVPLAP